MTTPHVPLPWQCTHCGTFHRTADLEKRCERDRRATTVWAVSLIVGITIMLVAGVIAWNVYVYDDWTCAFAECRKVFDAPSNP